ncbi:MAG: S-ribosylhomocysteine lyase [Verrucomicrobiae bacterium]|nr:S-ribosylhomocysteine lyase [Verrucomicrobiae bacterium]
MKRIESFAVDHSNLRRGLYVSRKDHVGTEIVTTFDIRMKAPNKEPVLDVPALHTLEHLGATFLRNHPVWAEKTVYFGPMGCRTGCYAIFKGDLRPEDVVPIMRKMFGFIARHKGKIPGASAVECGNYLSQDLPMARWEARKYLKEVLNNLTQKKLVYPPKEPRRIIQINRGQFISL